MRKSLCTLAIIQVTSSLYAAEYTAFSAEAFAKSQALNIPIVLHVEASWCPVCKLQAEKLKLILSAPEYKNLIVYKINYDTQSETWRGFDVQKQATFIGFRGRRETARMSFQTSREAIEVVIRSTLKK